MTGELAELVGQQTRRALAAVRDPRARALRRRRRARRVATVQSGLALVAGTVTAVIGSSAVLEPSEVIAGSVTAAFALGAGAAAVRMVRLYRTALPSAPPTPAELPPPGSAAREPLIRLARAEAGLADLLAVLERPRHGVAVVASETIESTRAALAEAATGLRGTAEAIRAVEQAAGAASGAVGDCAVSGGAAAQRAGLLDAVTALRNQLDQGVDEVCGLVTAAGAVVSVAGPEHRPAALADATDRLTGLAAGLGELPHRTG